MLARVLTIEESNFGSTLELAATATDTSITVTDVGDFFDSGRLSIDGDIIDYSAIDPDANIITTSALPNSYAEGAFVSVYPLTLGRVAWLSSSDDFDEEGMLARVPHALWDRLPLGIRDLDERQGEAVTAEQQGNHLVITDVRSREPVVDGSYIDGTTLDLSDATLTDGIPPASSPTPVVTGGPGFLVARWTAVSNRDPLTYEVHISASTGFTPGPSTLYSDTGSTSIIIKELADGTPLSYSTTYYVKLVAKDADGSASASAQDSGVLVGIGTGDLSPDGSPPASSPTPAVSGGPGYLFAKWSPLTNADLVEYEVHLSTNPTFTPGPSTLYKTVTGSSVFIAGDEPFIEGGPALQSTAEVTDGGSASSTPTSTQDGGGA